MSSPTTQRTTLLDALRSFALFGVVWSNYAVFALQVLCSRWWLARFRFGPFEWAWRSLAYGRWMPMRMSPTRP